MAKNKIINRNNKISSNLIITVNTVNIINIIIIIMMHKYSMPSKWKKNNKISIGFILKNKIIGIFINKIILISSTHKIIIKINILITKELIHILELNTFYHLKTISSNKWTLATSQLILICEFLFKLLIIL